eukprot:m51a1_g12538 hypothetical protein (238) ;mRNA; f:256-2221
MLWRSEMKSTPASRWSLCCENGKDEQSALFRKNLRAYNCALQFASSTIDVEEAAKWGMYVFDSLEAQADARTRWFDKLDRGIIIELERMLEHENSVVAGLRHAYELDDAAGGTNAPVAVAMEIVADVPGSDQRRYNEPVVPSVAAIIPDRRRLLNAWRNIFAKHRLMVRGSECDFLHRCGRLFEEYAIDQFIKVEQQRMSYYINNKMRINLPASFVGGPRYMSQLYQDGMAAPLLFH